MKASKVFLLPLLLFRSKISASFIKLRAPFYTSKKIVSAKKLTTI